MSSVWISKEAPEGSSYEFRPDLETFASKHDYPFNLTLFVVLSPETAEEDAPPPLDEKTKSGVVRFHEEIAKSIQPVTAVYPYARFWHAGLCQMEFRVAKADLANEKLQALIEEKSHTFEFDYRMFPDGVWMIPQNYLSGAIAAAQEDGAENDEEEDSIDEALSSPGIEAFQEEQYEKAVALLKTEVAEEAVDDPERWMMLADAYNNLNDLDQAEKTSIAALDRFPTHGGLLRSLGVTYIRQGRLAEAEVKCREGISVDNLRASLHHNLACALALQGKTDEALEAIHACVQIEPFRRFDIRQDTDFDGLREHPRFLELTDLSSLGMVIGSRHTENSSARLLLLVFPGRIDPIDRGEQVEEPLQELLAASGAGTVLGGAVKLGMGMVEDETYVEVGTDDMDQTVAIVRAFLAKAGFVEALLYPDCEVSQHRDPAQALRIS